MAGSGALATLGVVAFTAWVAVAQTGESAPHADSGGAGAAVEMWSDAIAQCVADKRIPFDQPFSLEAAAALLAAAARDCTVLRDRVAETFRTAASY